MEAPCFSVLDVAMNAETQMWCMPLCGHETLIVCMHE